MGFGYWNIWSFFAIKFKMGIYEKTFEYDYKVMWFAANISFYYSKPYNLKATMVFIDWLYVSS
jgi:hypothetical protein